MKMNKSFFNNDLKTNSAWWPEQNCNNNYDRDDYGVTESFLKFLGGVRIFLYKR